MKGEYMGKWNEERNLFSCYPCLYKYIIYVFLQNKWLLTMNESYMIRMVNVNSFATK